MKRKQFEKIKEHLYEVDKLLGIVSNEYEESMSTIRLIEDRRDLTDKEQEKYDDLEYKMDNLVSISQDLDYALESLEYLVD
jgi:hypothetical protein